MTETSIDTHDDDIDLDDLDERDDTPVVRLLRKKLESSNKKRVRDTEGLKDENARLKRELNFAKAGLNDLDESKQKALLATIDGDAAPEQIRAKAVEFGWAEQTEATTQEIDDETREAVAGHERISAAAAGAQTGTPGVLKAEEVAEWPTDRLLALNKKAPDDYERLMRGEDIPRPPGF